MEADTQIPRILGKMDFNYFDLYKDDNDTSIAPDINEPSQIRDEMSQLMDIASKIGSYRWSYKEDFANAPDNEEHIGIVAQQLLQVPGLEAAVSEDPETGVLKVDTQYVALAALGLVAALARYVGLQGENKVNGETDTELSGELPDTTTTEESLPEEFQGTEQETDTETEGGTDDRLSGLGQLQADGSSELVGDTTSTGSN